MLVTPIAFWRPGQVFWLVRDQKNENVSFWLKEKKGKTERIYEYYDIVYI